MGEWTARTKIEPTVIDTLYNLVFLHTTINKKDIMSSSRLRDHVIPRIIITHVLLARNYSLMNIARILNRKEHAVVINYKKILSTSEKGYDVSGIKKIINIIADEINGKPVFKDVLYKQSTHISKTLYKG